MVPRTYWPCLASLWRSLGVGTHCQAQKKPGAPSGPDRTSGRPQVDLAKGKPRGLLTWTRPGSETPVPKALPEVQRDGTGCQGGAPWQVPAPSLPTVPGFPLQWALALTSGARDPPGPCRMARVLLEPR